jgi:hypothetical protein
MNNDIQNIHYVGYADQGDLLIFCVDRWTEVALEKCGVSFPIEVYLAEPFSKNGDQIWYTFNKKKVTCSDCLSKLSSRSGGQISHE